MDRQALIKALEDYYTADAAEEIFIPEFLELLLHPDAFQRQHLPGHLTGSSWILDSAKNLVLLTHHAKLNKWLQPGGHADGDENILNVARREALEETGLQDLILLQEDVFDIDIHNIPARDEFPQHLHYDVRFLFQADSKQMLKVTKESHALAWIPMHQLADLIENNTSIMRMANKVKGLF